MKQKHKIYWLHSHFLYWMGGTKYIYEIIKRLSLDNEVVVIVENASDYSFKMYQDIGVKLVSLNKLTSTSILYWLTLPYQILDTKSRVQKIVDSGGKVIVSMFPLNTVAKLLKIEYYQLCFEPFAFFHDPDFISGFSLIKQIFIKLLKVLYSQLDIISTRSAKAIITLNQVTQKGIAKIYHSKSTPIYTGIDTKHFYPHISKSLSKKYQGYQVIVHSTDYSPVKNTNLMIDIFESIHQVKPQTKLLITSTQENITVLNKLKQTVENLGLTNSVEFLGFVDYDLLPQIYSLAKVLVQCSYSELSGTTSMALPVKEALACGTLCIRSPITKEDVVDGVTGYLVDPRDKELMVEKTIKILEMSSLDYDKSAKLARDKIVHQYSWDNTVKAFSSIIGVNHD